MAFIQSRPAIPEAYLDTDSMKKTVKLCCKSSCSTSEIVMLLQKVGVPAEDVLGLYRGPPVDAGFYVTLASELAVEKLRAGELTYRQKEFNLTTLGKQVVTVRVHWLPLYFSDSLIRSVLADYGSVLSVDRATTIHGNRHVKNGMRVVRIEVDEVGRRALPHLVKFGCGTAMLLTIPGRPPLCLKCSRVGHLRKDCVPQPSYAATVSSVRSQVQEESSAVSPPTASTIVETGETSPMTESSGAVEEEVKDDAPPAASTAADDTPEEGAVTAEGDAEGSSQGIVKRPWEASQDSFTEHFPPNKVVRASPVETDNPYSLLGTVASQMIGVEEGEGV